MHNWHQSLCLGMVSPCQKKLRSSHRGRFASFEFFWCKGKLNCRKKCAISEASTKTLLYVSRPSQSPVVTGQTFTSPAGPAVLGLEILWNWKPTAVANRSFGPFPRREANFNMLKCDLLWSKLTVATLGPEESMKKAESCYRRQKTGSYRRCLWS